MCTCSPSPASKKVFCSFAASNTQKIQMVCRKHNQTLMQQGVRAVHLLKKPVKTWICFRAFISTRDTMIPFQLKGAT